MFLFEDLVAGLPEFFRNEDAVNVAKMVAKNIHQIFLIDYLDGIEPVFDGALSDRLRDFFIKLIHFCLLARHYIIYVKQCDL